jgi:hypothetical protein
MPYSIDTVIDVNDPLHVEHHEALATAVNDLDSRVSVVEGSSGSAPDATTTTKGVVQLAGDLAGTATAPTVPGLASRAPLASPALTGTPTAPTATAGTNTTQIATTAFVTTAVSGKLDTSAAAELIRDTMGTALVAGANITLTVNDAGDTITIASTGGGGGSSAIMGMIPQSGEYLFPPSTASWATGTTAYATGTQPLTPMLIPAAFNSDGLSTRIATAESGIDVRLLLYSSDAEGHPSTLVATGTATSGSAGGLSVSFSSVSLPAGVYWMGVRTNGGSTIRFWALGSNNLSLFPVTGSSNAYQRNPYPLVDVGTYASPNSSVTVSSFSAVTGNDIPYVGIKRV